MKGKNAARDWHEVSVTLDKGGHYGLAFSGGSDSSFLLTLLIKAGIDVKAYLVRSAFTYCIDLEDAHRVVSECGAPFEIIDIDILSDSMVCSNSSDRCYWCKRSIFGSILKKMSDDGRSVLLDGTNASDDPDRRPGFKALTELDVVSPLRIAGFSKDDVRAASRSIGLFTASKPSLACLATKVPVGTHITQKTLIKAAQSTSAHSAKYRLTKGA